MGVKGRAINTAIVQSIHRGMDVASAILLLTGQITIGGVFIAPEEFGLSLSGPFTGSGAIGTTPNAQLIQDGLDVIAALLLIIGEFDVIGTYITANRFTIVIGGPPIGVAKTVAYVPSTREFFNDLETMVTKRCEIRRKR